MFEKYGYNISEDKEGIENNEVKMFKEVEKINYTKRIEDKTMTRDEEIEKAIYDYSKKFEKKMNGFDYFNHEHIEHAFIDGIEWADNNPKSHWISIEDDLPCNHDRLLIKCLPYNSEVTKPVLVLVADGSYQVCEMFVNEKNEWEWSCNDPVLNWLSIPELPKE